MQLKSTDAQQITVRQKDIRVLEQHAAESHKAPVFAIQFLNTGEVWLMAKQEDLAAVASEMGRCPTYVIPACPPEAVQGDLRYLDTIGGEISIDTTEPPRNATQGAAGAYMEMVRSSTKGKEDFYRDAGKWKRK